MKRIKKWIYSVAGKLSVTLMSVSVLLICLIFSSCGEEFLSIETANTINNILIGIATGLIGIVVTVSFVQYAFDKQDEAKERKFEITAIKRYDKYMRTLILKYLMFYLAVTTRLNNRNNVDVENAFNHSFKFSDMADMYLTSAYINENLMEPSIVLFYRYEDKLREYMLRMLENIDFKYNAGLEEILLDFVTKSMDLNMKGNILGALNTMFGNKKASEEISKDIANEQNDWLEMYNKGKLKSNTMLPYVIFYYTIQDQVRLLKKYNDYIISLDDK